MHADRCAYRNLHDKFRMSFLITTFTDYYVTPQLRTKFGERAFSYAGPAAWNSLPADIRDETDSAAFMKLLKTHYFNMAFKSS